MSTDHLHYWLAAIYLPGIGPRRMMRWLEYFKDIEKLFLATSDELKIVGLNAKQIQAVKNPEWRSVENDLHWTEKSNHHLLSFADSDYPPLLKEIPDPPLILFIRGNKMALSYTQVGIVGSRHATAIGLQNAEQFAYHLTQAGLVITSGLALGIDGASHRGALAAQGVTIGVAGTGLHHSYPQANRKLVEEIVNHNGAVISEFPLDTPPQARNFPRRNRIISGLSAGLLVVEAALKSGSLITVKHALEQGREVFAIPGSIHNPLARGCHHLIRQGAKLVEMASDIVEELSFFSPKSSDNRSSVRASETTLKAKATSPPQLELTIAPQFQVFLEHIGYEITPIDMIIWRSGLTPGEVSSILLKLELQGYIESVTGGYIRVSPIN
jgi:DNA processing protein